MSFINSHNRYQPEAIPLFRGRKLTFDRPLVVGILNATPDSFSDGGKFNTAKKAVARGMEMIAEGVDMLDIGGESSRPGAKPVTADEEIKRVVPVIDAIRQESDIPISIDTYKAATALKAIEAGADIINDISAFRFDSNMGEVAGERNMPVILMHMKGTPRDMQNNPVYEDVNGEIIGFFEKQINFARICGVDRSKIMVDPGIGFGKRLVDNMEILKHISEYSVLECPILIGTSRKSFINMIHKSDRPPSERIGGSLASALTAVAQGAHLLRVHDVYQTVEALKVLTAIRGNE